MLKLNEKFLPSFSQEEIIHTKIFSIPVNNGLLFKSASKVSEDSSLTYEVGLIPLFATPVQNDKGRIVTVKNKTTDASLVYAKSNSNGKIFLSLGQNSYILVNTLPVEYLSVTMQTILSNKKVRSLFTVSLRHKYFHPTIKATLFAQPLITTEGNQFKTYDPTRIETLDYSFTVGTKNLSFGMRMVNRFDFNDPRIKTTGFNAIVQKQWSKNMAEIVLVNDAYKAVSWRFQRNINKNWEAATSFNVTSMLTTNATFAYKAEIGKTTVRGFFSTEGVVKSLFKRKISDIFDFSVSATLDHPQKKYNLGVAFSYNN